MLIECFSISVISANDQSKALETLNDPPFKKLDEGKTAIVTRKDIDENITIATITVERSIEAPVTVGRKFVKAPVVVGIEASPRVVPRLFGRKYASDVPPVVVGRKFFQDEAPVVVGRKYASDVPPVVVGRKFLQDEAPVVVGRKFDEAPAVVGRKFNEAPAVVGRKFDETHEIVRKTFRFKNNLTHLVTFKPLGEVKTIASVKESGKGRAIPIDPSLLVHFEILTGTVIDKNDTIEIVTGKGIHDNGTFKILTGSVLDQNDTIEIFIGKDIDENSTFEILTGAYIDKSDIVEIATGKDIEQNVTFEILTGTVIDKNDTIEIITGKNMNKNGTFKILTGTDIDKNETITIVTGKDIDENGTFEILTLTDIGENDTIAIVTEKYNEEIDTTAIVKEEDIGNIATDNIVMVPGVPEKNQSPFIPTDPYNFKFITKRPIKSKTPNVNPLSVKTKIPTKQDGDFRNTDQSKSIIKGYFQIISEPLLSNDYSKKPENQIGLDYPNDPSPLSVIRKNVEGKEDLHSYPVNVSNEMLQKLHFKLKKSLIPHKPEDASKIYKILDHAANKKYQELKKQTMEDQIIAELKNKQHSKTRHKDSYNHDEQPLPKFMGNSKHSVDYSLFKPKRKYHAENSSFVKIREKRDINIFADINALPGNHSKNLKNNDLEILKQLLQKITQLISTNNTKLLSNYNFLKETIDSEPLNVNLSNGVNYNSTELNDMLKNFKQLTKDQENVKEILRSHTNQSSEIPDEIISENSKTLIEIILKLIRLSRLASASESPNNQTGFTKSPLHTIDNNSTQKRTERATDSNIKKGFIIEKRMTKKLLNDGRKRKSYPDNFPNMRDKQRRAKLRKIIVVKSPRQNMKDISSRSASVKRLRNNKATLKNGHQPFTQINNLEDYKRSITQTPSYSITFQSKSSEKIHTQENEKSEKHNYSSTETAFLSNYLESPPNTTEDRFAFIEPNDIYKVSKIDRSTSSINLADNADESKRFEQQFQLLGPKRVKYPNDAMIISIRIPESILWQLAKEAVFGIKQGHIDHVSKMNLNHPSTFKSHTDFNEADRILESLNQIKEDLNSSESQTNYQKESDYDKASEHFTDTIGLHLATTGNDVNKGVLDHTSKVIFIHPSEFKNLSHFSEAQGILQSVNQNKEDINLTESQNGNKYPKYYNKASELQTDEVPINGLNLAPDVNDMKKGHIDSNSDIILNHPSTLKTHTTFDEAQSILQSLNQIKENVNSSESPKISQNELENNKTPESHVDEKELIKSLNLIEKVHGMKNGHINHIFKVNLNHPFKLKNDTKINEAQRILQSLSKIKEVINSSESPNNHQLDLDNNKISESQAETKVPINVLDLVQNSYGMKKDPIHHISQVLLKHPSIFKNHTEFDEAQGTLQSLNQTKEDLNSSEIQNNNDHEKGYNNIFVPQTNVEKPIKVLNLPENINDMKKGAINPISNVILNNLNKFKNHTTLDEAQRILQSLNHIKEDLNSSQFPKKHLNEFDYNTTTLPHDDQDRTINGLDLAQSVDGMKKGYIDHLSKVFFPSKLKHHTTTDKIKGMMQSLNHMQEDLSSLESPKNHQNEFDYNKTAVPQDDEARTIEGLDLTQNIDGIKKGYINHVSKVIFPSTLKAHTIFDEAQRMLQSLNHIKEHLSTSDSPKNHQNEFDYNKTVVPKDDVEGSIDGLNLAQIVNGMSKGHINHVSNENLIDPSKVKKLMKSDDDESILQSLNQVIDYSDSSGSKNSHQSDLYHNKSSEPLVYENEPLKDLSLIQNETKKLLEDQNLLQKDLLKNKYLINPVEVATNMNSNEVLNKSKPVEVAVGMKTHEVITKIRPVQVAGDKNAKNVITKIKPVEVAGDKNANKIIAKVRHLEKELTKSEHRIKLYKKNKRSFKSGYKHEDGKHKRIHKSFYKLKRAKRKFRTISSDKKPPLTKVRTLNKPHNFITRGRGKLQSEFHPELFLNWIGPPVNNKLDDNKHYYIHNPNGEESSFYIFPENKKNGVEPVERSLQSENNKDEDLNFTEFMGNSKDQDLSELSPIKIKNNTFYMSTESLIWSYFENTSEAPEMESTSESEEQVRNRMHAFVTGLENLIWKLIDQRKISLHNKRVLYTLALKKLPQILRKHINEI
ncbi:hypothetical protein TNIN_318361 [Trichonephila inaurata madagascariensis]|uniref:Uncharacterized protein n=1 Tax=Trichonephila inaurata madagascariensis TaxID=2747483 RepID=A0A8X6IHE3_9ARAC|nr:hypothetical protein TNIN_318361 [Trichonephila inaurata madagascariensis]